MDQTDSDRKLISKWAENPTPLRLVIIFAIVALVLWISAIVPEFVVGMLLRRTGEMPTSIFPLAAFGAVLMTVIAAVTAKFYTSIEPLVREIQRLRRELDALKKQGETEQ